MTTYENPKVWESMDNNEWQGAQSAQSHIYRWKGLHTHTATNHMKYFVTKRWKRQRRHCLSCDTLDVINHCSRLITEQIRSTAWTTNQPPINQRLAIFVIDEYYSRRNKRPHIHSTPLHSTFHFTSFASADSKEIFICNFVGCFDDGCLFVCKHSLQLKSHNSSGNRIAARATRYLYFTLGDWLYS